MLPPFQDWYGLKPVKIKIKEDMENKFTTTHKHNFFLEFAHHIRVNNCMLFFNDLILQLYVLQFLFTEKYIQKHTG